MPQEGTSIFSLHYSRSGRTKVQLSCSAIQVATSRCQFMDAPASDPAHSFKFLLQGLEQATFLPSPSLPWTSFVPSFSLSFQCTTCAAPFNFRSHNNFHHVDFSCFTTEVSTTEDHVAAQRNPFFRFATHLGPSSARNEFASVSSSQLCLATQNRAAVETPERQISQRCIANDD